MRLGRRPCQCRCPREGRGRGWSVGQSPFRGRECSRGTRDGRRVDCPGWSQHEPTIPSEQTGPPTLPRLHGVETDGALFFITLEGVLRHQIFEALQNLLAPPEVQPGVSSLLKIEDDGQVGACRRRGCLLLRWEAKTTSRVLWRAKARPLRGGVLGSESVHSCAISHPFEERVIRGENGPCRGELYASCSPVEIPVNHRSRKARIGRRAFSSSLIRARNFASSLFLPLPFDLLGLWRSSHSQQRARKFGWRERSGPREGRRCLL